MVDLMRVIPGLPLNYTYVADGAGNTEMYSGRNLRRRAESEHSSSLHFYGQDRNAGGGNIMVVNGAPALGAAVWNQNNTTVLPNTTYYFSAWAMSVVNGNNAILQFSINGSQVGTIGYLPNGYTNTCRTIHLGSFLRTVEFGSGHISQSFDCESEYHCLVETILLSMISLLEPCRRLLSLFPQLQTAELRFVRMIHSF
jgi:hypothetical protein